MYAEQVMNFFILVIVVFDAVVATTLITVFALGAQVLRETLL